MESTTKTCRTCGETKQTSGFYAIGTTYFVKDCKECYKARVKRRYYKKHADVCAYERKRWKDPRRREYAMKKMREHRAKNPEKTKARNAVANAIRDGRIIKPTTCPHCGSTERIQAHHHDYTKPLDVAWACFKCHRSKYHGQRVS